MKLKKDPVLLVIPSKRNLQKQMKANNRKEEIVKMYSCTDCGKKFVTKESDEIFCPVCGSLSKKTSEVLSADENIINRLTTINHCDYCDEDLYSTKKLNHCITCGSDLDVNDDLLEDDETEEVEEVEDAEETESDEDEVEEEVEDAEETDEVEEEEVEDEEETDEVEEDEVEEDEVEEDEVEEDEETKKSNKEEVKEQPNEENKDVSNIKSNDLEIALSENSMVILIDKKVVATIFKDKMPENGKKLFENGKIQDVFKNLVDKNGLINTINSFYATPESFNLSDSMINQEIENQVTAKVNKLTNDFITKFTQSFQLAIIGSEKGIFPINNPIKNRILNEIGSDKESIITSSFANYSQEYYENILEKTNELMIKSNEVRNELVDTILNAETTNSKITASIEKDLSTEAISYRKKLEEGNMYYNDISKMLSSTKKELNKENMKKGLKLSKNY